jgi:hypothetical protein
MKKDECRMSHDENMTNTECRKQDRRTPSSGGSAIVSHCVFARPIRHSCFVIFSTLVIGHSSFSQAPPPNEIEKHMRPPAGIEAEPQDWWEDWPTLAMVGGVSLLGLAAGAGLALRVANRKKGAPARTRMLPNVWALQELARLEASPLVQGAHFEVFHTELSGVIRKYIEQQFRLEATKQTTPEFLTAMRSARCLTTGQQALLAEFLEQCDLVKFAGIKPTAEQSRAAAAAARRFVQQTAD